MKDLDCKTKDLSDFFSLISEAKKENKEKLNELVANSFDDYFWRPLKNQTKLKSNSSIKKSQKKKIKEQVVIQDDVLDDLHENETTASINEDTNILIEKSLGLLSEPDNVKIQNDPLTPLNQKFITLDELNKHYNIFLSRIQQQLSTLGGGGESNLTYMDVPVITVTSSSYTIKSQDYYIGVNYTGAVTVTLPKAEREGKIYVIKDELGEASKGSNRYITILPTGTDLIDGRDRAILAYDYGSLTFMWKNNSWRVI